MLRVIFQDNVMPAWKAENNIYTLPWPTQSQDINIMANIWRVLKIRIKRRVNEIKKQVKP